MYVLDDNSNAHIDACTSLGLILTDSSKHLTLCVYMFGRGGGDGGGGGERV